MKNTKTKKNKKQKKGVQLELPLKYANNKKSNNNVKK